MWNQVIYTVENRPKNPNGGTQGTYDNDPL